MRKSLSKSRCFGRVGFVFMLCGRKSCISTFTAAFATATTSWNFQHGSTGWARVDVVTSRYPWNVRTYILLCTGFRSCALSWHELPFFTIPWTWTDGRNLTWIQQTAILSYLHHHANRSTHQTTWHLSISLPFDLAHLPDPGTWFCVGRQHCGVIAMTFSEGHWIERLQPS